MIVRLSQLTKYTSSTYAHKSYTNSLNLLYVFS